MLSVVLGVVSLSLLETGAFVSSRTMAGASVRFSITGGGFCVDNGTLPVDGAGFPAVMVTLAGLETSVGRLVVIEEVVMIGLAVVIVGFGLGLLVFVGIVVFGVPVHGSVVH